MKLPKDSLTPTLGEVTAYSKGSVKPHYTVSLTDYRRLRAISVGFMSELERMKRKIDALESEPDA